MPLPATEIYQIKFSFTLSLFTVHSKEIPVYCRFGTLLKRGFQICSFKNKVKMFINSEPKNALS